MQGDSGPMQAETASVNGSVSIDVSAVAAVSPFTASAQLAAEATAVKPSTPRDQWKSAVGKVATGVRVSRAFTTLKDMTGNNEIKPGQLKTLRVLGTGAFASVELCTLMPSDGSAPQQVAVKRLKPEIVAFEDDLCAFLKEIAVLKKLVHKNIVGFIGVGCSDPSTPDTSRTTLFLVQELMEGGTLKKVVGKQMLDQTSLLYSYTDALRWCTQVAQGLEYLHASKPMIIHRDLKLENLLLKGKDLSNTDVKISDFGLAAALQPKVRASGVTGIAGRPSASQVTFAAAPPPALHRNPSFKPKPSLMRSLSKFVSIREDPEAADPTSAPSGLKAAFSATLKRMPSLAKHSSEDGSPPNKVMRAPSAFHLGKLDKITINTDLSGRTGSYMYMAPEMYLQEPYTEKVDVFSFGVIMFEVLSRYLTIMAISINGTEAEIEGYAARVAGGYRPPIPMAWPQQLQQLVQGCWAQEPSTRPAMSEVVKQLQDLVAAGTGARMDKELAPACGCVIC